MPGVTGSDMSVSVAERRLWIAALVPLCYGGAVHYGVLTGRFLPALLLVSGLLGWALVRGLRGDRPLASLPALLAVISLGLSLSLGVAPEFLFLHVPPLLVPLVLALLFGLTLRPGATPLVTQIAYRLHEVDAEDVRYTHRVTQAWVVFFLALAGEAALLAGYADAWIWSLFTNGLNYLFIGLFFLGEYLLRIRVRRERAHPPFLRFLQSLATLDARGIRIL
jgi:uncharacterized membrane protein